MIRKIARGGTAGRDVRHVLPDRDKADRLYRAGGNHKAQGTRHRPKLENAEPIAWTSGAGKRQGAPTLTRNNPLHQKSLHTLGSARRYLSTINLLHNVNFNFLGLTSSEQPIWSRNDDVLSFSTFFLHGSLRF